MFLFVKAIGGKGWSGHVESEQLEVVENGRKKEIKKCDTKLVFFNRPGIAIECGRSFDGGRMN